MTLRFHGWQGPKSSKKPTIAAICAPLPTHRFFTSSTRCGSQAFAKAEIRVEKTRAESCRRAWSVAFPNPQPGILRIPRCISISVSINTLRAQPHYLNKNKILLFKCTVASSTLAALLNY
jgi:hypothetical protein